jgi:hypothetical protein
MPRVIRPLLVFWLACTASACVARWPAAPPLPSIADRAAVTFDSLRRAAHVPGLAVVVLHATTVLLALTLRHVLAMTANGDTPGTRFWCNPPSYSWASRPIAELTGQRFSTLVDSLILRPAGMRTAARFAQG